MKIKKILILPLFILIMVCTLSFNIKATTRFYDLPMDTDDNYLIYVYSDSHSSYNMPLIKVYEQTLINRVNDLYYFYPDFDTDIMLSYGYWVLDLYCFHLQYVNVGLDDFELHIDIYSLKPDNFLNTNQFTLIKQIRFSSYVLGSGFINLTIDFENVIDIQNYSGINVNINSEFVYSYLLGNSMNPTYSTLGILIEEIKEQYRAEGYREGYVEGFEAMDGGIIRTIVTPILNFFDSFFSIEIAPNISIGNIVLIPLVMGVIGLVLYFWRKD